MVEVPVVDLNLEETGILSPPVVVEPLYACAPAVTVCGLVAGAELSVDIPGLVLPVIPAGPALSRTVTLPSPLQVGQLVRAQQRESGTLSGWSPPATVRDHHADYPGGLPRPRFDDVPFFDCAAVVSVSNLVIGSTVVLIVNQQERERLFGVAYKDGQPIYLQSPLAAGDTVTAVTELCGEQSPSAAARVVQPAPPAPLPAPTVSAAYDGGNQLLIGGLVRGAWFKITRNGARYAGSRTWWDGAWLTNLAPALSSGDVLEVTQWLCAGEPPSPAGTGQVLPCGELRAPGVAPIQDGDKQVHVTGAQPSARIKVFASGTKVGDATGELILLTRPVRHRETIHVVQQLGACQSATAQEVVAKCHVARQAPDPADLDFYPVGWVSFTGPTVSLGQLSVAVSGVAYYPAEVDGDRVPFRERLAGQRRVPVVFLVHGQANVSATATATATDTDTDTDTPNGFDYVQRTLARQGIVAVALDMTGIPKDFFGADIGWRAMVLLEAISYFRLLDLPGSSGARDRGGRPIFQTTIDFGAVGLLGHSRGGAAVELAAESVMGAGQLPGVSVAAVLAVAPASVGASPAPRAFSYLVILPAADDDQFLAPGGAYYDAAEVDFKGQLHIDGAIHGDFNRAWHGSGSHPPGGLSAPEHCALLSAYGCAFFRAFLLGHDTLGYLVDRLRPPLAAAGNVHASFQWAKQLTVDDHEQANGFAVNSLYRPTQLIGPGLAGGEYDFRQSGTTYTDSFYGATRGMVLRATSPTAHFRTALLGATDLRDTEVWVRVAEVYERTLGIPRDPVGVEVGLSDASGAIAWLDSDDVGGVPRPYDRRDIDRPLDYTKTVFTTLRFPARCFGAAGRVDLGTIEAILLRPRPLSRAVAFDVLQIVSGAAAA